MSTKDRHYWSQLRAALTAGHWSSSSPAKAFNGAPLSWSELFRKFNKHCKGYVDVAEVASQTHALSLLLIANSKDEDQDEPVRPEEYPLELGDECILASERVEEARSGYDILKKIESSNFDVSLSSLNSAIFLNNTSSQDIEFCIGVLCICSRQSFRMLGSSKEGSRRRARTKSHSFARDTQSKHTARPNGRIKYNYLSSRKHRRNRIDNIYCRYQGWSRLGNNGNYPQPMLTR